MDPKLNTLSDIEIIDLIINQGMIDSYRVLYTRYANLIYNKCLQFESDKQQAEDMAQDVLVKIYLKLSTFNQQSKFSTWVYSICYNHCVDYTRKKRNNLSFSIIENQHSDQYYEDANEPSDEQIISFKIEKLKMALNIIDPEEKSLLLLKYQDGISISDLAKILNKSEGAIKMKLKRTKIKLKSLYDNL